MRDFNLIIAAFTFAVSLAVSVGAPAFAQSTIPVDKDFLEENMPKQIRYIAPKEPFFEKVTFLRLDPPRTLDEQIESLIHGIYVDIPPEYDHFGYEVRRYMSAIAGPDILGSQVNLKAQIKNIKNAEIILRYWHERHEKDVDEIEAKMETGNISSSTRSSFKYHRGIASAFFVESNSWIRNNRAMLEYLVEIGPDAYKFKSHSFTFTDRAHLRKFAARFIAQQKSLKIVLDYTPFRMMVY